MRLLVVQDRFYQCGVFGPAERVEPRRAEARRLIDSFAVLPRSKPAAKPLALRDVEACRGRNGPVRERLEYYAHDEIEFRAWIEGHSTDDRGHVDIAWKLELKDPEGRTVVTDGGTRRGDPGVDGARLPYYVALPLPAEPPPGRYSFAVTVFDRLAEKSASFSRELIVKPTEFAIVAPRFYYDAEGEVSAPAAATAGQTIFVQLRCIGFDRSQKRIAVAMTMQLVDEAGKPVLPKAIEGLVEEDDAATVARAAVLSFNGNLTPTRVGECKLRVLLHDRVANNFAKWEASLKVNAP
jgi:hypothetical protein